MEYDPSSSVCIDTLPFVKEEGGKKRPATKEEMATYCRSVADRNMTARFFSENDSLMAYGKYVESHFRIIPAEWNKIAAINETEGGVEAFFENCRTNDTLVDRLLIPTVEEGIADENGTEKGQGNGFAELFESQRDHFRKQRELQKRIKEMQGVVEQMEIYTKVQHQNYKLEQDFFHINGQLKALYGQVQASQEKRRGITQALQETEQALLSDKARTEQDLEACGVAESEALCTARRHDFDVAETSYAAAEEKRLTVEKLLYSLIYSRLNREYIEAQQAEQAAAAALAELAQDEETQEIQQKLDENSRHRLRKNYRLSRRIFPLWSSRQPASTARPIPCEIVCICQHGG